MALPFFGLRASFFSIAYIQAHLPNSQVIGESGKIPDLIWISELGGVNPRRGYPDLYRPPPTMMGLMYQYGADR
jgi:hypothetical protein